jgi:hypothetical protein
MVGTGRDVKLGRGTREGRAGTSGSSSPWGVAATRLGRCQWWGEKGVEDSNVPAHAHHVENGGELHVAGFGVVLLGRGDCCACESVLHQYSKPLSILFFSSSKS